MTDCMYGAFHPRPLNQTNRRAYKIVSGAAWITAAYLMGAVTTLAYILLFGGGLSTCAGLETCLPTAATLGAEAVNWPAYWSPQVGNIVNLRSI